MPIYFRNAPVREPFIYDSIGNHWLQDATSRPNGYPFYHYLQTESGCGRITIQGKSYLLHEQEGVLIAPSIRHSYLAQTPEWYTCFCTFSGTVEGSISKILNNRPILFTTKEQCRNIRALLQDAMMMKQPPSDKGRRLRIYYVTQVGIKPPLFSFKINSRPLMHFSYARYLENKIREGFGFEGTSIKFVFREKGEKED